MRRLVLFLENAAQHAGRNQQGCRIRSADRLFQVFQFHRMPPPRDAMEVSYRETAPLSNKLPS